MVGKDSLKKEIGLRVKEIRENKMHMNKNEFSKLINMKSQYLGTVENGNKGLTIEKAIEICNKTDVSADYLLLGVNNSMEVFLENLLPKYSKEEIFKSIQILNDFINFLK